MERRKPPFVNVGVIRNTNFTKDGALDDSDIAYLDVETKNVQKRRLQFGDVILEKSGGGPKQPVGACMLFDKARRLFRFSNFTSASESAINRARFEFLHKYLYWIVRFRPFTEGDAESLDGHPQSQGDAYKAIRVTSPAPPRTAAASSPSSTKRSTASPPPRPTPKRTCRTPANLFESHGKVLSSAGERRGWTNPCCVRDSDQAIEGEFTSVA